MGQATRSGLIDCDPLIEELARMTNVRVRSTTTPLSALLVACLLMACQSGAAVNSAVGTLEMVEIDIGPLQPSRAVRVLVREGGRAGGGSAADARIRHACKLLY